MNIIIIGSSGGIGRQLVSDLKESHKLFLGHHNKKPDFDYPSHQVNADDFDSLMNFVKEGKESMRSVDALICLTGTLILKPAHKCTEEDFNHTVNNNFKAAFSAVRASGELLQDCAVILMSTAAASIGLANHELISGVKSGVEGIAKSASKTYARKNLRFNTVSPGLVDTPLTSNITSNDIILQASKKMLALQRIGQPKDISNMIKFLIKKENNWITGQNFIVDGGLSSTK